MRCTSMICLVFLLGFTVGCKKKVDPTSADGGASGSDAERLQGLWKIESFDSGDNKDQMPADEMHNTRLQFKGDRITVFSGDRVEVFSTFALDPSKDPKTMSLTELREDGQPVRMMTASSPGLIRKSQWLYKFEGETLVLAVTKGTGEATEFKPRTWKQSDLVPIFILKLKKTDEATKTDLPKRGSPTKRSTYRSGTAK